MAARPSPQTSGSYLRPRARRGLPAPGSRALGVLGLVVVALAVVSLFGDRGLRSYLRLRGERAELEAEVTALKDEHDTLEQELRALEADPAALERVAREIHGMHAPGERVLQVVVEDAAEESPRSP